MKKTKILCDHCGKELAGSKSFEVEVCPPGTFSFPSRYDLCSNCNRLLYRFMHGKELDHEDRNSGQQDQ